MDKENKHKCPRFYQVKRYTELQLYVDERYTYPLLV